MTRSSAPGVSLWCSCGRNAVLTRAIGVFVTIGLLASVSSATAELLKVSVPQPGQWDTAVTELSTRGGMFKKYGLDIRLPRYLLVCTVQFTDQVARGLHAR